jgi:hypothetical protein
VTGTENGQNRTMIDPVLLAARRQNALDRIAELLDDWGSPHPRTRAIAILEAVTDCGYRLPGADEIPLRGPGSTPQGRAAALAQIRSTLGTRHRLRDAPSRAALPPRSPWQPPAGTRTPPEAPRGTDGAVTASAGTTNTHPRGSAHA